MALRRAAKLTSGRSTARPLSDEKLSADLRDHGAASSSAQKYSGGCGNGGSLNGLEDVTPSGVSAIDTSANADFATFFAATEAPLRRALMAAYGFELGREATAEALAWAWEHRANLADIQNPLGYLFRVGQSRVRRRKLRILHVRNEWTEPWVEPKLSRALRSLSANQRLAVVLVHGYSWTMAEVGFLLGVKVTTVQNHLERGLARLREQLEVTLDV